MTRASRINNNKTCCANQHHCLNNNRQSARLIDVRPIKYSGVANKFNLCVVVAFTGWKSMKGHTLGEIRR